MANYNQPYTPDDVQLKLMNSIYADLLAADQATDKDTKLALYESPTGTGKTLSIICPVMTYLRDVKLSKITAGTGDIQNDQNNDSFSFSDDEPDWVTASYEQNVKTNVLQPYEDFEESIDNFVMKAKIHSLNDPGVKRR